MDLDAKQNKQTIKLKMTNFKVRFKKIKQNPEKNHHIKSEYILLRCLHHDGGYVVSI